MFIMWLTVLLVLFFLRLNAVVHRPWLESFFFAVALAVRLTQNFYLWWFLSSLHVVPGAASSRYRDFSRQHN